MVARGSEDEVEEVDEEEEEEVDEEEEEDEGAESSDASCSGEDGSSEPVRPTPNILQRGSRRTAGRNSVVREGKALEDDETFWGHEAFAEGSSDSDVHFSSEALDKEHDSSDSDFDESEAGDESGDARPEEEEEATRPRARGRRLPPQARGPARRPPPRREAQPRSAARPRPRARAAEAAAAPDRSARTSTLQRRAETEAREARRGASGGARAGKKRAAPVLTQQERLEEAARTEVLNLQEFQAMRRWEDESKQRSQRGLRRRRYTGPRTRFVSSARPGACGGQGEEDLPIGARRGVGCFVELIGCDLPEALRGAAPRPPPQAPRCAVTGLPAKYRDPVTGLAFATASAFAQLRGGSSGSARISRLPSLTSVAIKVDSP